MSHDKDVWIDKKDIEFYSLPHLFGDQKVFFELKAANPVNFWEKKDFLLSISHDEKIWQKTNEIWEKLPVFNRYKGDEYNSLVFINKQELNRAKRITEYVAEYFDRQFEFEKVIENKKADINDINWVNLGTAVEKAETYFNQKDVWLESAEKESVGEKFDKELNHIFGDKAVTFYIRNPRGNYPAAISCSEDNMTFGIVTYAENIHIAKGLVNSTIQHFDKEGPENIYAIGDYLDSQAQLEEVKQRTEDVWIKDEQFFQDKLRHTFGSLETEFIVKRNENNMNKADYPFLIIMHDRYNTLPGDYSRAFCVNGDEKRAKELVEDAIKNYAQNHYRNIYDVEKYIDNELIKNNLIKRGFEYDTWHKNGATAPEELIHKFKNGKIEFAIHSLPHWDINKDYKKFGLSFGGETDPGQAGSDWYNKNFEIHENTDINSIKKLVGNTIEHFDKLQENHFGTTHELHHDIERYIQKEVIKIDVIEYIKEKPIKTIDDYKRGIKELAHKYPKEFGNDSIKCGKAIIDSVPRDTQTTLNLGMIEAGCGSQEKTKKVLDCWAGIASRKREKEVLMGRQA